MKRSLSIITLSLLVLGLNLPVAVSAKCPTYLTNLLITQIDVDPHQISCGSTFNITVGVVYPNGFPATLWPSTMSFKFTSPCFSMVLENVHVFRTGKPGFYTCNLTWTCSNETTTTCSTQTTTFTCNLTTATTCYTTGTMTTCNQTCPYPTGTVNVSVLGCSCSDVQGNFGPTDDISSDVTLTTLDNSMVNVNTPITSITTVSSLTSIIPTTTITQPPTTMDIFATYGVPIVILILLIIGGALLLFKRMHGRK